MKIKNLPELVEKLKCFLPEYLESKGIKIDKTKVQCPNKSVHKHDDLGKLSAAFLPKSNNKNIYCFVENRIFDIFDCYSIIEGKKITGQNFFTCIQDLCTQFNIGYEEEQERSLQAIERNKQQGLIEELHQISLEHIKDGLEYYKKRNLTKEKIVYFKVGFLRPEFIPEALDAKFKKFYNYKLTTILSYPALAVPLFNNNKQYSGLVLRQFDCPKEDRYLNIILPPKILFNMNNVKGNEYIYLVEGTFDAMSLFPETNVAALLTNTLHDRDVNAIAKENFKIINIAIDPDRMYQGATDGFVQTIMKLKNIDSNIKVVYLPDNLDPDEFVTKNSIEAFKELPTKPALAYLVENYTKELLKIETLYEYISGNPNIVRKEKYIAYIAKKLKLSKKQITKEIAKLEEQTPLYNIVSYVQEKGAMNELLDDFTEMAWNKEFKGIPSGYPIFDNKIGGFENTIYLLIGFPESGKTTLLLNFIYKLMLNPSNYVAFYSLDDGAKRAILPRLMSIVTKLTSKIIREPNDGIKKEWIKGISILKELKENYIIKDGADIRTLWDLDKLLKIHYNIAKENNKKFILVIDNIHALKSSFKLDSTQDALKVAQYLKRIPQEYSCPIIATAEVPKSSAKIATGKDIKESIDWWYAARLVGSVNSSFNTKEDTNLMWRKETKDGEKFYPIIQLYVSKNQTGNSYHGSFFFKFNPTDNHLVECSAEESRILNDGGYIY